MKKSILYITLICTAAAMCSCSSGTSALESEEEHDIYFSGYLEGYQDAVQALLDSANVNNKYIDVEDVQENIWDYCNKHEYPDEYTLTEAAFGNKSSKRYTTKDLLKTLIEEALYEPYLKHETSNKVY